MFKANWDTYTHTLALLFTPADFLKISKLYFLEQFYV